MQYKIKGCRNDTCAVGSFCLKCAAKVWCLTHSEEGLRLLRRKQGVRA